MARQSGPNAFPGQAKLMGFGTPTLFNSFSTSANSPASLAAALGVLKAACVQVWLPISKPISCSLATSAQDMKCSRSVIHPCEMKNVAPKPFCLSKGATAVSWDLTASSKVKTTVLGGITSAPETHNTSQRYAGNPAAFNLLMGFVVALIDQPCLFLFQGAYKCFPVR